MDLGTRLRKQGRLFYKLCIQLFVAIDHFGLIAHGRLYVDLFEYEVVQRVFQALRQGIALFVAVAEHD